jgi:hypothetical protein
MSIGQAWQNDSLRGCHRRAANEASDGATRCSGSECRMRRTVHQKRSSLGVTDYCRLRASEAKPYLARRVIASPSCALHIPRRPRP